MSKAAGFRLIELVEEMISVELLVDVEEALSACFGPYGGKQIPSKYTSFRLFEQCLGDDL